ncbi:MAG: helix-turn-helix domain-containing protein [Actinomycetota bacterium]
MTLTTTTSRLRTWREDRGWTLDEVAGLSGLSPSGWSRLERGERGTSPAMKVLIARRLGARVDELFEVDG